MTANAPVDVSLATNTGTLPSAAVPAPPGWPWRRAALFLAGVSLLSHPPCLEAGRTVMAGHGRWMWSGACLRRSSCGLSVAGSIAGRS
jgi:hypothetical protein